MNPDYPSCDRKESVCQVHPELGECNVDEQLGIELTPEPELYRSKVLTALARTEATAT